MASDMGTCSWGSRSPAGSKDAADDVRHWVTATTAVCSTEN